MVTSGYGPVRLGTAVHLWFGRMIHRTPRVTRAMPVRASCGPNKGIFNVFHILRGPCGTRKGAVRHPYGHARELIQPELTKIRHGRRIWPYGAPTGPLRSPHGLFTGCLWYQNPYRAPKFIMHAIRTAPHGAYTGPVSGCTIFVQNSPGTALTGLGSVMWLGHKISHKSHTGQWVNSAFPPEVSI